MAVEQLHLQEAPAALLEDLVLALSAAQQVSAEALLVLLRTEGMCCNVVFTCSCLLLSRAQTA